MAQQRREVLQVRSQADGAVYSLTFEGDIGRLPVSRLASHLSLLTGVDPALLRLFTSSGRALSTGSTLGAEGFRPGEALHLSYLFPPAPQPSWDGPAAARGTWVSGSSDDGGYRTRRLARQLEWELQQQGALVDTPPAPYKQQPRHPPPRTRPPPVHPYAAPAPSPAVPHVGAPAAPALPTPRQDECQDDQQDEEPEVIIAPLPSENSSFRASPSASPLAASGAGSRRAPMLGGWRVPAVSARSCTSGSRPSYVDEASWAAGRNRFHAQRSLAHRQQQEEEMRLRRRAERIEAAASEAERELDYELRRKEVLISG